MIYKLVFQEFLYLIESSKSDTDTRYDEGLCKYAESASMSHISEKKESEIGNQSTIEEMQYIIILFETRIKMQYISKSIQKYRYGYRRHYENRIHVFLPQDDNLRDYKSDKTGINQSAPGKIKTEPQHSDIVQYLEQKKESERAAE